MDYRFYLVDANARFRAAEAFACFDDREAAEIAATVFDACADVCEGYELWRGAEHVAGNGREAASGWRSRLEDLTAARQAKAVELEERLQRSFACVRASRRLLQRTAELRSGRLHLTRHS